MQYWLMKSEPSVYSWDQLQKDKRTHWNGVRNYQAAHNLRAMRNGDRAFFYHSNEGMAIVGICEIVKEAYPDPSDKTGKFVMVDVAPLKALPEPVTLATIKTLPKFKEMALIRLSRLSVQTVSREHWKMICKMGGITS